MPRLDKDIFDNLTNITAYPTTDGKFTVFQYCWIDERDIFYVPRERIIHQYKYPLKTGADGACGTLDPDMEEEFDVVVITDIKWDSAQMKPVREASAWRAKREEDVEAGKF